jgi:hypothetical protein
MVNESRHRIIATGQAYVKLIESLDVLLARKPA